MFWLSLLMVFGTLALIGINLASETPALDLGAALLIRGRIPWAVLGVLWAGVALGVASLVRARKLPKLGAVLVEIAMVTLVSWYVAIGSALPAHTLTTDVGEPFPAYSLMDQDGVLHAHAALEKRAPALYLFYRGHW